MSSYFHGALVDQAERQHQLAITELQTEIDGLRAQIDNRLAADDRSDERLRDLERAEQFKSLHARVLTYAMVHSDCRPFDVGFGPLLSGTRWDIETLATDYRAAVEALAQTGRARIVTPRAGPRLLVFEEGDSWPIANPSSCAGN